MFPNTIKQLQNITKNTETRQKKSKNKTYVSFRARSILNEHFSKRIAEFSNMHLTKDKME